MSFVVLVVEEHMLAFFTQTINPCRFYFSGNVNMTEEQIVQNMRVAVNYMVSLLKGRWRSVRSLHVKSTMGPSLRIYDSRRSQLKTGVLLALRSGPLEQ